MKMQTISVALSVVFLTFNTETLPAQLTGGVGGGLAKVVGEGSETIKLGLSLDAAVFYKIKRNIHAGLRAGYHRWSPNGEVIGEGLPNFTSGGYMSVVEIVPTLRITTANPGALNIFAQSGAGYFRTRVNTRFTTTIEGTTYSLTGNDTRGDFGLNLGGGLILSESKTLTLLYPQLSLIFADEITKYFSVNVGFHFH